MKVIGIILLVLVWIAVSVYIFILTFPKLKDNPRIGKWYKITNKEMKKANGNQ